MSGSGKFVSGLLIGTGIGVVAGMLLAPSSGLQLRTNLMHRSKKYSRQAVDAVRQYLENVRQGRVRGENLSRQETEEMLDRLNQTPNA